MMASTIDDDDRQVMQGAIEAGNAPLVRELLASGYPVDTPIKTELANITPLYRAAALNHVEMCEALLDAGADVNFKTIWGLTPLHVAILQGSDAAAVLLIERGANLIHCDFERETPLHYAVENNNLSLIRALVAAGADPNFVPANVDDLENETAKPKIYLTPFHAALTVEPIDIKSGRVAEKMEIVAYFVLEAGVDLDSKSAQLRDGTKLDNLPNESMRKLLVSLRTELAVRAAMASDDAPRPPTPSRGSLAL